MDNTIILCPICEQSITLGWQYDKEIDTYRILFVVLECEHQFTMTELYDMLLDHNEAQAEKQTEHAWER